MGPNRYLLLEAAKALKPLLDEVVFVGGQVAELLITSPGSGGVRPTVDVDVVVSATTYLEYHEVSDRLRELGLRNDVDLTCRWRTSKDIIVDVMPLTEDVLGFGSQWYPAVMREAVTYVLDDELTIKIPTPALFLATKWEAFEGRGENDLLKSHDLEDVIAVVAGREGIVAEVASSSDTVRNWIAERARRFLEHADATYALDGALPDAARIPRLIDMVRQRFVDLSQL